MSQDYKQRHAAALLLPEGRAEARFSRLFTELADMADDFKDDSVMLPAVEYLGAAILVLLNGDIGRLDQPSMTKQVEDTVRRAGGDLDGV